MADMNTLKYWLDCWEHVHDVLDLDTARYAIATLAVQEEIDWRLQHRIFEDGELEANLDGWPSVSACAALSNVGRSTAPGFTPFERMIEIHERPQRQRDKAAALAQKLLSRLPPRYQAAVLLAGWQLEAPRQPLADDLHETCPREITIQGIWSIQDVLSERLQLPAHKPFPSANALNIAAVRGRNMMMLEVDDICGHLIRRAA